MEIRRNLPKVPEFNKAELTNQPKVGEAEEMQSTSQNQGETERNNIIVTFEYDNPSHTGKPRVKITDDGKEEVTVARTDLETESIKRVEITTLKETTFYINISRIFSNFNLTITKAAHSAAFVNIINIIKH